MNYSHTLILRLFFVVLIALLIEVTRPIVFAATINVNGNGGGVLNNGVCSLPEAIDNANDDAQTHADCSAGTSGLDTITLAYDVSLTTVHNVANGNNGLPSITTPIVIEGNNKTVQRSAAISDTVFFRILHVASSGNLTLRNITVANGSATVDTAQANDEQGGAILAFGYLTIRNSTLTNNRVTDDGGALYSNGSDAIFIIDSHITDNYAVDNGGGFSVYYPDNFVITNTTIENNSAGDDGGGGQVWEADVLNITDATIRTNTAATDGGGGLRIVSLQTTIANTLFENNVSKEHGGGLYISASPSYTTLVQASTFRGNTAGPGVFSNGGGIAHLASGDIQIEDSWFENNFAGDFGGGLYTVGGTITDSTFRLNSASRQGGGIYGGNVINRTLLEGNEAEEGAGFYTRNLSPIVIMNTTVSGNSASDNAGGGFVRGPFTLLNSTIVNNTTADEGFFPNPAGGLYINPNLASDAITIRNTIVADNLNVDPVPDITVNCIYIDGVMGGNNNLDDDGSCAGINNSGFSQSGSLNLGALGNNGGSSKTHALLAGSSALNAGSNATCTNTSTVNNVDQRGYLRFVAGTCDIGAYEANAVTPPPSNTNLVYNPSFNSGEAGWKFFGSIQHQITNNRMNLSFPAMVNGWMRQFRTQYPLPNGAPMEASVDIQNPTGVAKTFRLQVMDSDQTNIYSCLFSVPPYAPLQRYRMQFKTNTNWEIIRLDMRPQVVGNGGLNVDNINLLYKPWLTITSKSCIEAPDLPAIDSNLIYNPGFDIGANDDAGWRYEGNIIGNVVSEVMNLHFVGSVNGWLRQFRTATPLEPNLRMVAWVTVSNPENAQKTFQFMMRDSDLSDTYLCAFTVPANAPARNYYMRFITQTPWEIIRVDVRPNVVDSGGLNFDDVNLRYRPNLTFTAKECIPPTFDAAPTPPDTELVANDMVGVAWNATS